MQPTQFPKLTQVKTLDVVLGKARYGGTPMPFIALEIDPKTPYRHLHALAHLLAARLEMETPRSERWCVTIDIRTGQRAVVSLDLVHADEREVQSALALLRTIAETSR